jgi:hypothetical protein
MRDEIVALIRRVTAGAPAEPPPQAVAEAPAQAQAQGQGRSSRRGRRSGGQQAADTQAAWPPAEKGAAAMAEASAAEESADEEPAIEALSPDETLVEMDEGLAAPELEEARQMEPAVAGPVQDTDMAAPAPRTGVEIVESIDRKGMTYHTMRDLRDGGKVQNVTRSSARRLWRYAIALKEKGTFQEDKVAWKGDLGVWHRYLRAGRTHYDLVQRGEDGRIAIYYGVTEDGIHGPWRALVDGDE